jgi:ABC-type phosphate transport system permease subunit
MLVCAKFDAVHHVGVKNALVGSLFALKIVCLLGFGLGLLQYK